MSRSSYDYDFGHVAKPCAQEGGEDPFVEFPKGPCTNPKERCPWYEVCDLPQKNPPKNQPSLCRVESLVKVKAAKTKNKSGFLFALFLKIRYTTN